MLANKAWWGYPTVIFGTGETARLMAETLLGEPAFGLRPVAVFDQTQTWADSELRSKVTVLHDLGNCRSGAALERSLCSHRNAGIGTRSVDRDDRGTHIAILRAHSSHSESFPLV